MLSEQNAVSSHVIPVCMLHLVFIPIFRLSIEQLMYVNNLRRRAVVGRPTKGCLLEKRVRTTAWVQYKRICNPFYLFLSFCYKIEFDRCIAITLRTCIDDAPFEWLYETRYI